VCVVGRGPWVVPGAPGLFPRSTFRTHVVWSVVCSAVFPQPRNPGSPQSRGGPLNPHHGPPPPGGRLCPPFPPTQRSMQYGFIIIIDATMPLAEQVLSSPLVVEPGIDGVSFRPPAACPGFHDRALRALGSTPMVRRGSPSPPFHLSGGPAPPPRPTLSRNFLPKRRRLWKSLAAAPTMSLPLLSLSPRRRQGAVAREATCPMHPQVVSSRGLVRSVPGLPR